MFIKRLGAGAVATAATVAFAPADTVIGVEADISVNNTGVDSIKISVAITIEASGVPQAHEWLTSNQVVPANGGFFLLSNVKLAPNEKIVIQSDIAGAPYRIAGRVYYDVQPG